MERDLAENSQPFVPRPFYSATADVLFFYARDVPSYAKRLNSFITVILADSDHSLAGVKIKSIKRLMAALNELGKDCRIALFDDRVKLGILITLARVAPLENQELADLESALDQFKDVEIDKAELVGA
ncbi:MAG: hypothetical protein J5I93_00265 [Pirellulaceae bacterium]|nr:hypothetical protein [Pirellulaceae bacterium]